MTTPPTTSTLLFGSLGLTNVENQVKGLIEAAEANIERLTAQIRELTRMREKERSILATLRLMVVPIGKLPTELLVEIFKDVVYTPPLSNAPVSFYSEIFNPEARAALRKVLRLAQVCPYWRHIVHSSPQLWVEGVVAVQLDGKKTSTDTYLSGLKDLLSRSSPFPISVSLAQNEKVTVSSEASASTCARSMLPTARRWQNLRLIMVSLAHFNGLAPGTFDTLERLQIQTNLGPTEPVVAFQSSPRLRSLTIGNYIHDEGFKQVHLFQMPWSQLTDLQVKDGSLGACRAILLQCNSLVSARFMTSHEWDFDLGAAESPVVVLPFLKTLTVTFSGEPAQDMGGIAAFFLPLALPSLQTLDLEFEPDSGDVWPTDVFSQFQSRSPNIEKISLLFSQIRSEGSIALLRHAPALTTLDIRCSWDSLEDNVFEALKYDTGDSAPLAPKLQNINLVSVGFDFQEALFEEAIRSRWWTDEQALPGGAPPRVARLKKVTLVALEDYESFSELLKARMLNELGEQGLELDLQ
ncbi:hypothetical protein FB451DRAFT_485403 [Mycena latifolia]|nr:hypothetical protein FB451DRAFT_485403 [Mycena latifolia]